MILVKNILVILPMSDQQKRDLEEQAPGSSFFYRTQQDLTPDLIRGAQVIIGGISPAQLAGADHLEWCQSASAGVKEYIASGHFPRQAVLTNATGAYGLAISEHMLGMLLSIQKKLNLYRDNQSRAYWHTEGSVTSIDGSRTLVIGLGDIGGSFARRMKALGSCTVGIKRHASAKPDYLDELHGPAALDEQLPLADIVALSLPETPETVCLLNRARLNTLKKNAIVLNVGRGNALDTEALCDLLASGHLQGAGLDVTDPEPLPPGHRLWSLQNAVITPHISGGFYLQATLDRIVGIATENLGRFMRGESLLNKIDFQTGYREFTGA